MLHDARAPTAIPTVMYLGDAVGPLDAEAERRLGLLILATPRRRRLLQHQQARLSFDVLQK